jgi:hypothetical protein
MTLPLESETVPLTCATATDWALAADGKQRKIKTDESKDRLARVGRDTRIIYPP